METEKVFSTLMNFPTFPAKTKHSVCHSLSFVYLLGYNVCGVQDVSRVQTRS